MGRAWQVEKGKVSVSKLFVNSVVISIQMDELL